MRFPAIWSVEFNRGPPVAFHSRAMWSCAMLLSLDEASGNVGNSLNKPNECVGGESFLRARQIDLFHQLAPLLLFSPLSPTDASMAMWAMAKAQYALDKGIFDQLAMSLVSEDMLERSSTRLISQALWACGRMVSYNIFFLASAAPILLLCHGIPLRKRWSLKI